MACLWFCGPVHGQPEPNGSYRSLISESIGGDPFAPEAADIKLVVQYTADKPIFPNIHQAGGDTFCLAAVDPGEHGGPPWNYILFVPADVQAQYAAGGGKKPTSGNPFLWYMLTYLGIDLPEGRTDWKSALRALFGQTALPKAQSKDVEDAWQ
jgi:hypothetical protein